MIRKLLIFLVFLPVSVFAQGVGPLGARPTDPTISPTTPTSGCVAGGVLRSISNLVECGAGFTYASGVATIGATGIAGSLEVTLDGTAGNTFRFAHSSALAATGVISVGAQKYMTFGPAEVATPLRLSIVGGDDPWIRGGDGAETLYLSGGTDDFRIYDNAGTNEFQRWSNAGDLNLRGTLTTTGTTGAQTISKTVGTVNFAAAATTLVVTNSLVTVSHIVMLTVQAAAPDATCTSFSATVASGSFTITANAACTAETKVAFLAFKVL